MSISPIYTAAFSTISINRGLYADRPFGGTTEESRESRSKPATDSPVNAVSAIPARQAAQVAPKESTTKSHERKPNPYPEKSTDSDKERSRSGDILDLSGQSQSKSLEKAEKAESSIKSGDLTQEERQQVERLKARDAEVRTHEAAHLAAAGQYAKGGPQYVYQTGPDGKQYAIGGSVSIDVSPVSGNPQATLQKAQQVRAAALAPAEPSGQDQKVASAASQMEADARLQLAREKAENAADPEENPDTYGPFGSLMIDKAPRDAVEELAEKSSFTSALYSRRNGPGGVASAYQHVQDQTASKRMFVAYA